MSHGCWRRGISATLLTCIATIEHLHFIGKPLKLLIILIFKERLLGIDQVILHEDGLVSLVKHCNEGNVWVLVVHFRAPYNYYKLEL